MNIMPVNHSDELITPFLGFTCSSQGLRFFLLSVLVERSKNFLKYFELIFGRKISVYKNYANLSVNDIKGCE
jgi:hypothetical protein